MQYSRYSRKMRILFWLLITLILLNLAFIFVQSMIPPEQSAAESDAVADAVTTVIPQNTAVGSFMFDNIRGLAHFFEFGLLGVWVSLLVALFFAPTWKVLGLSLNAGLLVAFIDETVQIFSGRVSSVRDIWTDIFGFTVFSLLTHLGCFITKKNIKGKGKI